MEYVVVLFVFAVAVLCLTLGALVRQSINFNVFLIVGCVLFLICAAVFLGGVEVEQQVLTNVSTVIP